LKVLLKDGLNEEGIKIFAKAGFLTATKKRNAGTLVKQVGEFDALIVRSATMVTREVIKFGAKRPTLLMGRPNYSYYEKKQRQNLNANVLKSRK
jgi:hypothetical protein